MACICCYYPEVLETTDEYGYPSQRDSEELRVIKIDGEEMMEILGLNEDQSILNCSFTVYAPRLFLEILNSYFDVVDFRSSLDILANEEKIRSLAESQDGEGGKSGEFFFMTKDKRLILKTTNEKESAGFLSFLYDYGVHFKNNPESQIGRIFGLFDITFEDIGKTVKLFVMESLDPVVSTGTLRKYDLKGSEHDRRVLDYTKEHPQITTRISKILKDQDFEQIERNLGLRARDTSKFLKNIKNDAAFFELHSLIDYSLLVTVVEKSKLPKGYLEKQRENKNYRILYCKQDDRFVYFTGIIDYFQRYTTKKKVEKMLKSLMKCDVNLETSSQPPDRYASRFFRKMTKYCLEDKRTSFAVRQTLRMKAKR
jgi:hypothetical protein